MIRGLFGKGGIRKGYSLDCSKIHAELGWQPQITFEQGLRQTVKWYLENNR